MLENDASVDPQIVIGLTGLKAAGKDEFAHYLAARRGFMIRSCGDEVRAALHEEGVATPTIAQQVEMGNRRRLESNDIAYWPKRVYDACRAAGAQRVIVNGLRHPQEVLGLSEWVGEAFTVVGVVAPLIVRAQRLLTRGRPGDPKTMEEFLQLDDTDRGIGQPPYGQQVDRTLALVPFENLYNNRGTLAEYHAWIERFVQRH